MTPSEIRSRSSLVCCGMKSVMAFRHKVFHLLAVVKRLYQFICVYSLHLNPRDSGVGVSGLLLGGGLSYLSPAHGFACDNFRSLDVVLPHGELVTVTGTNQYSDLFRALKGGGSRFGIVTRFEVNAIHTGTAADKNWFGGTINVCPNHSIIWHLVIHLGVQYPNSSSLKILKAIDNVSIFLRLWCTLHLWLHIPVHLLEPRSESW